MKKQKLRTTDLTSKDLPKTRKDLFFDMLKYRKMDLFKVGLLAVMFALPIIAAIFIFDGYIVSAGNTISDSGILSSTIFSLIFYLMLICIPCFMILFAGFSGLIGVIKKMVWQQGELVTSEFFYALKRNWKKSIWFGFIYGLSMFVLVVGIFFLLRTSVVSPNQWINNVGIGLCIVQFIVLSIVLTYSLILNDFYELKFKDILRDGFILLAARFFKNILCFIFSYGLIVGLCFLGEIGQIISLILFIVFVSVSILVWVLLAYDAFDELINKTNYPEYYKKGLYVEKKG